MIIHLEYRQGMRRFEWLGHDRRYEAYFHGWTSTPTGVLKAVCERPDGSVFYEDQVEGIQFHDK